jgi:hypothetical protein
MPFSYKYRFAGDARPCCDPDGDARQRAKEVMGDGSGPAPWQYEKPSAFGKQPDSGKVSNASARVTGRGRKEGRFDEGGEGGDMLGHKDVMDLFMKLRRIRGQEWEKRSTEWTTTNSSMGKQGEYDPST